MSQDVGIARDLWFHNTNQSLIVSSYRPAGQDQINSALGNTPLGPVPVHPAESAEGQIHYGTQVYGLEGEITNKPHISNEIG